MNYCTQYLRTVVREIVSHQVLPMPREETGSLSAVRRVAVSVGWSQRALLNKREIVGKPEIAKNQEKLSERFIVSAAHACVHRIIGDMGT